jgi:hypothetical protein
MHKVELKVHNICPANNWRHLSKIFLEFIDKNNTNSKEMIQIVPNASWFRAEMSSVYLSNGTD